MTPPATALPHAATPQGYARACAEAIHRADPDNKHGLGDVVQAHLQKLARKETT